MTLILEEFEQMTRRLRLAGLKSIEKGAERESKGVVIAIHGWLDNAASFVPLAAHLSLAERFYALDLPGHGLSEHRAPSADYHLMDYIPDVLAFMDQVAPNQAVTLLGHSLGGVVCALLAAAMPERVSRLVMLDSLGPYSDRSEQVLAQWRKAVIKVMEPIKPLKVFEQKELAIRARMAGVGKVGYDAASLLVARGIRAVEGGFVWRSDPRLTFPSLLRFSESQVKAILGGITCPTLLIGGDQGYFHQYPDLHMRRAYISQLEYQTVTGGHHFHMEAGAEQTARLIHDFIQRA